MTLYLLSILTLWSSPPVLISESLGQSHWVVDTLRTPLSHQCQFLDLSDSQPAHDISTPLWSCFNQDKVWTLMSAQKGYHLIEMSLQRTATTKFLLNHRIRLVQSVKDRQKTLLLGISDSSPSAIAKYFAFKYGDKIQEFARDSRRNSADESIWLSWRERFKETDTLIALKALNTGSLVYVMRDEE